METCVLFCFVLLFSVCLLDFYHNLFFFFYQPLFVIFCALSSLLIESQNKVLLLLCRVVIFCVSVLASVKVIFHVVEVFCSIIEQRCLLKKREQSPSVVKIVCNSSLNLVSVSECMGIQY